jgi:Cu-processing system permease protein
MDIAIVRSIATREARSGLQSRWFILYTAIFVVLIVAFAMVALTGSAVAGQTGFGRTSAAILNLMLLIVPLIGLTVGAQAIVSDRQSRHLDYLLAQPVSSAEVFVGKYLGAATLLVMMLVLGFGGSAVAIAARGSTGNYAGFAVLSLLTILLALAMLSIGFVVSSFATQTSSALGIALSLWLLFVIIGDLGLMGSAIIMNIRPETLLALTLINPLDTYKLLSVEMLQASLDVLGPAGLYATDRFGAGLIPLLLGLIVVWIVLPLPVGYWLFRRTDMR